MKTFLACNEQHSNVELQSQMRLTREQRNRWIRSDLHQIPCSQLMTWTTLDMTLMNIQSWPSRWSLGPWVLKLEADPNWAPAEQLLLYLDYPQLRKINWEQRSQEWVKATKPAYWIRAWGWVAHKKKTIKFKSNKTDCTSNNISKQQSSIHHISYLTDYKYDRSVWRAWLPHWPLPKS